MIDKLFLPVCAVILTVFAIGQLTSETTTTMQAKVDYAQHICDKASNELSGTSEQACGDALDTINAIYSEGKVQLN